MKQPDFQLLFESAPGLYLVLSPDFKIVGASNAYLEATMTKREEITGKDLFEVFPDNPNDPGSNGVANLRASLNAVLENRVTHTMEIQKYDIRRPDGTFEERSWKPVNTPVLNSEQEVEWIINHAEDVTNVISLNKALEKRAAELQESNIELERFAYIASHDLQEPLRMVTSFLQLLTKRYGEQLDETANEYIDFAVDGATRMKKLIHDLLEYSKVGATTEDFAPVDLNLVLADALKLFAGDLKNTDAKIDAVKLPVVKGRRIQLLQLFQNLLSNAIKYRSRKTLHIEIGYIDKKEELEFFVRDNGIGIDQMFNEKIFIIFQRLHNRKQYEGTGIGLAICKKIVEGHGGKIWVEPSPDGGSIFRFSLRK